MTMTQEVIKRIAPFMKDRGFKRTGRTFYYIANDIAFGVGFDMPSGLLYVTVYAMPLYVPSESIQYNYSVRINEMHGCHLPILNKFHCGEDVVKQWCAEFCEYVDTHILPLYKSIETPERILQMASNILTVKTAKLRVSPDHRVRLRMYTQLYLRNYSKVVSEMIRYRKFLAKCDYLTEAVRQKRLSEIDDVEEVLQGNEQGIINYLANTIEIAKRILEGKM